MELITLDLKNATEKELIEVISRNNITVAKMKNEITRLKGIVEGKNKGDSDSIDVVGSTTAIYSSNGIGDYDTVREQEFEDRFQYYYSGLLELTLDELTCDNDILPLPINDENRKVLYRIKAEILKDLKEIEQIVIEEGYTLKTAIEFRDEILLDEKRLEVVDSVLRQNIREEALEAKGEENKLIFVPTETGNARVVEELERIDPVYYEKFLRLLQSIKNGTFKGAKCFVGCSELAGLREVKDFKVRVAFVRLKANYYALVSAFVKKSDNELSYRNTLNKRYRDFCNIRGTLRKNLSDNEFLEINAAIERGLFEKLGRESPKAKTLIKDTNN